MIEFQEGRSRNYQYRLTMNNSDAVINESLESARSILIVKQSESAALSMGEYFRGKGYSVSLSVKSGHAVGLSNDQKYDAIIVDLNMPQQSDRSLLELLRRFNNQSTIIVISDKSEIDARVIALHNLADDFLVRPYELEKLNERVLTRIRLKSLQSKQDIFVGSLLVQPGARIAKRLGQFLDLTNRELELLTYLAARSGDVISRKELNERVFELDSDSSSNLVDVYVRYLRAKIEFENEPKLLHTFRGRGYMLGVLPDQENVKVINE